MPRNYHWTKEDVFNIAKKYKTKKDFKNNDNAAFLISYRRGWIKEMRWLVNLKASNGYWDKEKVFSISKKYKSKYEFYKKCPAAYSKAVKEKWLGEMVWLNNNNNTKYNKSYTVYAYEDYVNKIVYVGLTNDMVRRHKEHCNTNTSVNKYFGKTICYPKILANNLKSEESQYYEEFYIGEYKLNGWKILNTGVVGVNKGSLGASNYKWNKHKVFEESKKYKTRQEFAIGSNRAYQVALDNRWLDLMEWLQRPIKWSNEKIIKESKRYKTLKEFRTKNKNCYNASLRHNLLEIIKKENKW